jgi:CO/xanthine dehydrogenase Mo-binding subunit
VEGQLEGGAIYGMGYGLTEEVVIERGEIKTPSFSEYLLATSMDVPEVQTIVLESGDGVGPFGAKGVGEPSLNSIAPAIANAVYDAVRVRIRDLPLTPEKVLRALSRRKMNLFYHRVTELQRKAFLVSAEGPVKCTGEMPTN